MSIFTNNITPTLPSDLSWNKIGYIEWEKYLQGKLSERARNLWNLWATMSVLDPSLPQTPPSFPNVLKRRFSNKKKLSKIDESELNGVLERTEIGRAHV